MTAKITLADN